MILVARIYVVKRNNSFLKIMKTLLLITTLGLTSLSFAVTTSFTAVGVQANDGTLTTSASSASYTINNAGRVNFTVTGNFDTDAVADTLTFSLFVNDFDSYTGDFFRVASGTDVTFTLGGASGTLSDGVSSFTGLSGELFGDIGRRNASVTLDDGTNTFTSLGTAGYRNETLGTTFDLETLTISGAAADSEFSSLDFNFTVETTATTVPEPSSAALLGLGGLALLARRKK